MSYDLFTISSYQLHGAKFVWPSYRLLSAQCACAL